MRTEMPYEAPEGRNGDRPQDGQKSLALQPGTSLAVQTADHVREILTAAETSVERMRELAELERREIEEQALCRLEAANRLTALADERLRRILDLGDAVVELGGSIRSELKAVTAGLERAEAGRCRVEELADALRGQISQVEASAPPTWEDVTEAPGPSAANSADAAAPTTPEREPSNGARAHAESVPDEKEARLMALHMAMGGKTRSEVEVNLARNSRVWNLEEILDEVFGAGTPGTHTIAWRASSVADGA